MLDSTSSKALLYACGSREAPANEQQPTESDGQQKQSSACRHSLVSGHEAEVLNSKTTFNELNTSLVPLDDRSTAC